MAELCETVARILEEVAVAEILPRFQKLQDHEIRRKQSGELVTVADLAAEEAIGIRLRELIPGAQVIGEEAAAADPTLLDKLAGAEPLWVIDPVDGTNNFARGTPVFAVMVALVEKGRSVAAWIHDPIAGSTATAELGAGAWRDGRRLRVAEPGPPREMRGTLHASSFAPPDMRRLIEARRGRVGAIESLRCAGREYLRLAAGKTHFSFFTKLMPWDHLPGTLIQREAGGVARTLDGADYGPLSHRAPGLLLAPDPTSWQALHETLFGADGPE